MSLYLLLPSLLTNNVTSILVTIGFISASLTGLAYLDLRRKIAFYKKANINGPTPVPFFGNLLPMLFYSRCQLEEHWREKYGKCYVTFLAHIPKVTFADAEVIRDICISNFNKFTDSNLVPTFNEYQKNSLFLMPYKRWKKVRALMAPAFTSGKIKKMFHLLQHTSDDLLVMLKQLVGQDKTKQVDIDPVFKLYAMNGIATCGFGVKIDRQNEINIDKLSKKNKFVKTLVDTLYFPFWSQVLPLVFPLWFLELFTNIFKDVTRRFEILGDHTYSVIKSREARQEKHNDILSSLHHARLGEELDFHNDTERDIESHHEGYTGNESFEKAYKDLVTSVRSDYKSPQDVNLTRVEFISNTSLLLVVGTSTTREFLSSVCYALAFHQDIQQKLYEEVLSLRSTDPETGERSFNYESLMTSQYLDAVISEALRLFSAVIFLSRICNEDHYIEKYKTQIKAGNSVVLSIHAAHTDPEYWQNPHKYDPERFMPGNKEKIVPGSYLPFGLGPRQCLGMRFALTNSKVALSKLLTAFKILPISGMSFPPKEGFSSFLKVLENKDMILQARQ